ncbi:phosphotransferase enzyme family protein, partial [Metarhizium majus ARSEF 297]
MNSISKAEVNKRRQYFIADICSKIDKFCELGTRHHPKSPSCEPFNPNGQDGFTKHGGFNLCVFIKFEICPPEKWVIRVPFPDSPWVTERMSSEIATMRYVATKTTIPVPRVYAYSLSDDNMIKSPFLIMNYVEGKTLHELRFQRGKRTPDFQVRQVYKQIGDINLQLRHLEFPTIGALGLPERSTELLNACNPDSIAVQNRPLTLNMAMQAAEGYQPDTIIEQGKTFQTAREFVAALIRLSENQFNRSPDIGLDKRRGRSLLYARDAFHRFASKDWLEIDSPFVLLHGDITLHNNNILFNQDLKAVGVIDWEWSFVGPVQFLVPPVWLTGSGFGFMLLEVNWYKQEVERLLCQIKHNEASLQSTTLLSRLWETFAGPCGTAVATALLHSDYIYEAFWGILFWEIHGVDRHAPRFEMGKYSGGLIIPLLEDFMTLDKTKLLDQKRREQDLFWQKEQEFFGMEEKTQFLS